MPATPTISTFLDKPADPADADYIVFGAPLDKTSSNRKGTRFGPDAIRRESGYLDTYSQRTGLDWDDLKLADIGDVDCGDVESCLAGIEELVKSTDKTPFMLGGEHLITLGALRAIKPDLVIVYDAHLDLRDELFGARMSHSTYLRRGYEELGYRAIVIGARALSGAEVEYAAGNDDLSYVTSLDIIKGRTDPIMIVNEAIESASRVYLSIDMDVLDPAYAQAVGNPHPEGLSTTQLMDIITGTMSCKVAGLDLNEVYPHYDTGNTAATAAYIFMETLYSHIRSGRDD
jgi:agmatinase